MTTSNDDQTTQLPEWDETTPLPTASTTTSGQDATAEMPASSPGLTSDPLAIFREEVGAEGTTASGSRTAFDPAFTGETTASAAAMSPGASQPEAGAGSRSQDTSGTHSGATGTGPSASGAQTWSAPAWPVNYHDLPEAPSRGVRVGAFVWALLVCMVGAFLIAEAYITTFNLPVLGISAVAALGVILILTAIFSGRSKKSRGSQSTSAADAIRTQ